jgi:hypothetical protein
VDDLAQRVNSSGRNLRRLSEIHALPPPSRILRAIRLLDGFVLKELGVVSHSRLAFLLGYGDFYSLSRSCRTFAGEEIEELFSPGGWDGLAEALIRALWAD